MLALAVFLFGPQLSDLLLARSTNPSHETGARDESVTLFSGEELSLDFETVPKGGRAERQFLIRNVSSSSVTLTGIVTTCGCLRVQVPTLVFGPNQTIGGTVILDFRDEPGFVGDLLLRADAIAERETPAFALRVTAQVR
jgi:hypothetical protein